MPILRGVNLAVAKTLYVDRFGFDVRFEVTEDGKSGLLGVGRGGIAFTIDCPMSGHARDACVTLQVDSADAYYNEWHPRVDIRRRRRTRSGARGLSM